MLNWSRDCLARRADDGGRRKFLLPGQPSNSSAPFLPRESFTLPSLHRFVTVSSSMTPRALFSSPRIRRLEESIEHLSRVCNRSRNRELELPDRRKRAFGGLDAICVAGEVARHRRRRRRPIFGKASIIGPDHRRGGVALPTTMDHQPRHLWARRLSSLCRIPPSVTLSNPAFQPRKSKETIYIYMIYSITIPCVQIQ